MKTFFLSLLLLCSVSFVFAAESLTFYKASDPYFSYMGRGDFADVNHPTFWAPGAQIIFKFKGNSCIIDLTDEHLYGKFFNYIQLIVDGHYSRFKLSEAESKLSVGNHLKDTIHSVIICKTTESNIGYLQFNGAICHKLLPPPIPPKRKIECFGNSITCGTGSDQSEIPCGKGEWQDQHNSYLSYGPVTARTLHAQYHLTSVSGIGLIHSCCNMKYVMPQVYDKINLRDDTIQWDFARYQPDVVTICLGQNDGIQDATTFCNAYVHFVQTLRKDYPKAHIVLLSSSMADSTLLPVLKGYIITVNQRLRESGDKRVSYYFFSKRYYGGCDSHPTVAQHQLMANELVIYLKQLMHW
jgi:lysophospholipase L1-like esterase